MDDNRSWRNHLIVNLNRRGLTDKQIGDILLEVQSHIDETGETPEQAFGTPEEYACSRSMEPHSSRWKNPQVLWSYMFTLLGAAIMIGGAFMAGTHISRPLTIVSILVGFAFMILATRIMPKRKGPIDPVTGTSLMPNNNRLAIMLGIAILCIFGLISLLVILIL